MSEEITYSDYWTEVSDLAKSITEEARKYGRDIGEVLWETIDGHNWVIYTYKAQSIIRHSENDGYSAENFGANTIVRDGRLNWSSIAYGCLYGDVSENGDFDPPCTECGIDSYGATLSVDGLCKDCREEE